MCAIFAENQHHDFVSKDQIKPQKASDFYNKLNERKLKIYHTT